MFYFYWIQRFCILTVLVTFSLGSIDVRRSGWLDRVVQYHKKNFYNDIENTIPVQLKVTMQEAPDGYVDSSLWTFDSVMHLLVMIHESETARPVRQQLRRMLRPSRRFMSRNESFKAFPSLMKFYKNEFYYDIEESPEFTEPPPYVGIPDDNAIIMVSNPVEARLPSARISVKLLRDILDARASAARFMSTATVSSYSWRPVNKTTTTASAPADDGDGGDEDGSGSGDEGGADGDQAADGSGDGAEAASGDNAPTTDAA